MAKIQDEVAKLSMREVGLSCCGAAFVAPLTQGDEYSYDGRFIALELALHSNNPTVTGFLLLYQ